MDIGFKAYFKLESLFGKNEFDILEFVLIGRIIDQDGNFILTFLYRQLIVFSQEVGVQAGKKRLRQDNLVREADIGSFIELLQRFSVIICLILSSPRRIASISIPWVRAWVMA